MKFTSDLAVLLFQYVFASRDAETNGNMQSWAGKHGWGCLLTSIGCRTKMHLYFLNIWSLIFPRRSIFAKLSHFHWSPLCFFLAQQSLSKWDRICFQGKDTVTTASLQPERREKCLTALWSAISPTSKSLWIDTLFQHHSSPKSVRYVRLFGPIICHSPFCSSHPWKSWKS